MSDFPGIFRLSFPEENNSMITQAQVELVQKSFARVQPLADQVAGDFYRRLFDLDPSLRPMFRGNLEEQGRKLMQVLTVAVAGLTRLDQLVPVVEALGRRHADYGVRDEHYSTVGAALLETLQNRLAADFTPEVRTAWLTVYQVLASAMMNASRPVAAVV
jgi:hemoglobin-like flavoprotein